MCSNIVYRNTYNSSITKQVTQIFNDRSSAKILAMNSSREKKNSL